MTDKEIQELYQISSEEYYEAMEGMMEWYKEIEQNEAYEEES